MHRMHKHQLAHRHFFFPCDFIRFVCFLIPFFTWRAFEQTLLTVAKHLLYMLANFVVGPFDGPFHMFLICLRDKPFCVSDVHLAVANQLCGCPHQHFLHATSTIDFSSSAGCPHASMCATVSTMHGRVVITVLAADALLNRHCT